MKFKMTFDKDLKETMVKVLKNEKNMFLRSKSGLPMKMLNRLWKKQMGASIVPEFDYEFVSDTEAVLDIKTGIDAFIKEEAMLKKLKDYEKISKNKIKIEVVK